MCLSERNNTPHDRLDHISKDALTLGFEKFTDSCDYISYANCNDISSNEKDFLVVQLNVCGLISKQQELSKLITNCSKRKVDVVMLCET